MLLSLAGMRRQHAGDMTGAAALLREAVELAPHDAGILSSAGDALRYTGELGEAVRLFDRALAIDPMLVAAWFGRAAALDSAGDIAGAADSYARVAELAPDTPHGHAGLAATLSLLGRSDEARAAAARALALAPQDAVSQIALARCDLDALHIEAAIDRLQRLTARPGLAAHDRVVALSLLGDALDRLDAADEAFRAYSAANARFAEMHAGPNAPPVALQLVEALDKAVVAADPAQFRGPAPAVTGEADRHIFLLGYARSGTTLVEQVLATAPGVETLEEEPTLAAAAARYLSPDGIAALGAMSADEAEALRAAYWQAVRDAGVDPDGKTFVDMDPFKALHLPLIARLFPDAKVIIMRRDPRDVVWSCFRRTFVYNPVTYEFCTLSRAARHYDAVMRLTEHCLEKLPLDAVTVRYVDLIQDFDGETRRLCAFASLPWSEDMRRFDRTAMGRAVKTRSAAQVRRGLFDGTGQWRRYASQLAPVLPILQPWVEKFGYAA
jgi:tetratricopeptide (TPR) repeat protein